MEPLKISSERGNDAGKGIGRSLVALVLVAVLPLLFFGSGVGWMVIDQKKAAVAQELASTTRALRVAVDRELESQFSGMTLLAADRSLDSPNLGAFQKKAAQVLNANGDWLTVVLIDPRDHRIVASSPPAPHPLMPSLSADGDDQVVRTGAPLVVGAYRSSRIIKAPIILLLAPVKRGSRVPYVLGVAMKPQALSDIFVEHGVPASWTGAALDHHMMLAARSREPERYVGVRATQTFIDGMATGTSGMFSAFTQEGTKSYAVFSRSPRTGWVVVLGVPAAEVDGPIQSALWKLAAAAGVLIGFALVLAAFVGREIVRRRTIYEQALQKSEADFRSVVEDQTETICRLQPDGTYTFVNQAFCKLVGKTFSELVGHIWQPQAHPEDISRIESQLGKLSEEQPVVAIENRIFTATGDLRWMQFVNRGFFDASGQLLLIQSVGRDITEIRRAQTEIDRYTDEVRDLYNNAPCGYHSLDRDGKFLRINDTELGWLGYQREEIIGKKSFSDLITPEGQAIFRANFPGFLAHLFVEGLEFEMVRKDGTRLSVLLSASAILDEDGQYVMSRSVLLDITERNRIKEELKENEERFGNMFRGHGAVMLLVEPGSYSIVDANLAAERFYGYSRETLLSMKISDINTLPMETLAAELSAARPAQKDSFIFAHRLASGEIRAVEVHLTTIKLYNRSLLFSIIHDVTQRQATETALRNSEQRYKALFSGAGEGIFIMSTAGLLVELNESFASMHGYRVEEMSGMSIKNFDTPETSQKAPERMRRILAGEPLSFEVEHYHRDGHVIELEVTTSLISVGDEFYVQCLHRNISQRKRSEEALLKAKSDAEAANRSKSQFLANMSHEIRTPMNGIMGMTQLLQQIDPTDEQMEYLQDIMASARSLLSLINDILDLSKIEAGKIDLESNEFSLRAVVSQVTRSQIPLAHSKGLALHTVISDEVPDCFVGDQLRLKQILLNVLGNAVKFTAKGKIAVSVSVLEIHEGCALLKFMIGDTGIGISPEALGNIFMPFVQADASTTRTYGGTGLGLSICVKLSELLGGRMWAESTEGVGSEFHLQIPFAVSEKPVANGAGAEIFTDERKDTPLHILVADDQELNLKFAVQILKRHGHTVVTASDGQQAFAAWERGSFDLVLMDVHMPVMDGVAAAKKIRAKERDSGSHTPIIALTAFALKGDDVRFLDQGFDGYVSKPVNIDALFKELRRCGPASRRADPAAL